jgi:hypothetical protein
MRLVCAPVAHGLHGSPADLSVVLFSQPDQPNRGGAGASLAEKVRTQRLRPSQRAWDLLSVALSVVVADTAAQRAKSPDGWTRELEVVIALDDPSFWTSQTALLRRALQFLTTDRWQVTFVAEGARPPEVKRPRDPNADCVSLLSGGLDSLVGAIDLTAKGRRPFAVSHITAGDREHQQQFARLLSGGLEHLQVNHNADCPGDHERSQRARSLAFLAYGVLAASTLRQHREGGTVSLYVCENGLISLNPPLTPGRLGSLSTRTTHPTFLRLVQQVADNAGLHVKIENPYQFATKGEMLLGCADQALLTRLASSTTSCGRFARFGFRHCGRCVPCLIRRAAFRKWRKRDRTAYVYTDLSIDDVNHARFDDVRSAAMGIAEAKGVGIETWLGSSLADPEIPDLAPYAAVADRGLKELGSFLKAAGVK